LPSLYAERSANHRKSIPYHIPKSKSHLRRFLTSRQLWAILPPVSESGGCSSAGRALQSHCRGQGFESPQLHQPTLTAHQEQLRGAVAQLGARLNGIQKVRGSSPLSSTKAVISSPCRIARRGLDAFVDSHPRATDFLNTLTIGHSPGPWAVESWRIPLKNALGLPRG
jgi:hypothetical protein